MQSVETHCLWMLVPPADHPNVDWSIYPAGTKDLPADVDGFRGYIVEFYNQVSDCSIQDSHQALCNFKALLDTLKCRHPRLKVCSRETDGATTYNSKCVAVFMEEMGRITGIRVCSHTHNEPGHGSDQCDSCGANCVRACYAWHIKHGIPINHGRQTVAALQDSDGLKGTHTHSRMQTHTHTDTYNAHTHTHKYTHSHTYTLTHTHSHSHTH